MITLAMLIFVASGTPPTDKFCDTYIPQILDDKDFDLLSKLPEPLQSRIRDNEVNYLCDCLHWEDKICSSTQP